RRRRWRRSRSACRSFARRSGRRRRSGSRRSSTHGRRVRSSAISRISSLRCASPVPSRTPFVPETVAGISRASASGVMARTRPSPWRLGGLSPRQFAQRLWGEFWEDEVLDRAAALAYYFLFALFPSLLFLTALVGLFPGALMDTFMTYISQVVPPDAAS